MVLAEWFKKRLNGNVTGVGKSPLRRRFSKFRQSRIGERSKAGAQKVQRQSKRNMSQSERRARRTRQVF